MTGVISSGEAGDMRERLRSVERSSATTASDMAEHVATCLEQHKAIGGRFDGVDQRLDVIKGQLQQQNHIMLVAFGLFLIGEAFGWQKAFGAALKLMGVAP
jgi:hypothetical protein